MTGKRFFLTSLILCLTLISGGLAAAQTADPLPSWNEGKAKQSIINFVTKVTKAGSPDFVPPAERIAAAITPYAGRYKGLRNFAEALNYTDLDHFSQSFYLQIKNLDYTEV